MSLLEDDSSTPSTLDPSQTLGLLAKLHGDVRSTRPKLTQNVPSDCSITWSWQSSRLQWRWGLFSTEMVLKSLRAHGTESRCKSKALFGRQKYKAFQKPLNRKPYLRAYTCRFPRGAPSWSGLIRGSASGIRKLRRPSLIKDACFANLATLRAFQAFRASASLPHGYSRFQAWTCFRACVRVVKSQVGALQRES